MNRLVRVFPARIDALAQLAAFVEEVAGLAEFTRHDCLRLTLVLEELFTNTVEHGYGGDSEAAVEIACDVERGRVAVTYEDAAPGFNPLAAIQPPDERSDRRRARRPGKLGLVLIARMASDLDVRADRPWAATRILAGWSLATSSDRWAGLATQDSVQSAATPRRGGFAMRGKHVLMDTLEAHGVELLFGNPGTTESPIIDALVDRPRLRYIMALHEAVALGAAHYYAQATGKTGVVNLHVAPGLGQRPRHALQRLGSQHASPGDRGTARHAHAAARAAARTRPPGHGRAPHQVERAGGAGRRDGAGAAPRPQGRARSPGGARLRGAAHRRPRAGDRDPTPCRPAGCTGPASPIRPAWRPPRSYCWAVAIRSSPWATAWRAPARRTSWWPWPS